MTDYDDWLKERLRTIVLATDFHQNSRLALGYAALIAEHFNSKLIALNAFEYGRYSQAVELIDRLPSTERKAAEAELAKFTREAGVEKIVAELVVLDGLVVSTILKALAERSADLLVIGTEGTHKGLDHFILGSNTEALMLGSRCPTLTVGPRVPEHTKPKLSPDKVIYISDFSIASTAGATYAYAIGQAFGVATEVYQIASKAAKKDSVWLKTTAAQYCDILQFIAPDLPAEWFDSDFQLSRVVPEADLIAKVSEVSNLVVLGVQPASFLQRHLQSSLAYRLLANAASPVLTVPAENTAGRSPKL
jgi:nucleotide-binding universal stress UspA family protein